MMFVLNKSLVIKINYLAFFSRVWSLGGIHLASVSQRVKEGNSRHLDHSGSSMKLWKRERGDALLFLLKCTILHIGYGMSKTSTSWDKRRRGTYFYNKIKLKISELNSDKCWPQLCHCKSVDFCHSPLILVAYSVLLYSSPNSSICFLYL